MFTYSLIGFFVISILGTLLHFAFEIFGKNKFVGFFVATNESVWEHLKLAFFPTFLWAIAGAFFEFNNFVFGVFLALLIQLVFIPLTFYTYSHFTKRSILLVDIISFYVFIGLSMFVSFQIFSLGQLPQAFNIVGIVGIALFAIAFSLFTAFPPKIFLFHDPEQKE